MKNYLHNWSEKYYILFLIGINSGLRVSDLRNLKVEDVYEKDHIEIFEQKTGKRRRFLINEKMGAEINSYIIRKKLVQSDYLVQSNMGENKPLSRNHFYYILNKAAKACGITDKIGTHTMRKTFGYWHYQRFHDIAILQDIFNHSSPSITLRYIGINDDMKDATIRDFYL